MPYQYKVVELREKMIGGKMSGDRLEKVLNEHASQGWQLKAITSADVKGRMGPGGVEGLLVTFERRSDPGRPGSRWNPPRRVALHLEPRGRCRVEVKPDHEKVGFHLERRGCRRVWCVSLVTPAAPPRAGVGRMGAAPPSRDTETR